MLVLKLKLQFYLKIKKEHKFSVHRRLASQKELLGCFRKFSNSFEHHFA